MKTKEMQGCHRGRIAQSCPTVNGGIACCMRHCVSCGRVQELALRAIPGRYSFASAGAYLTPCAFCGVMPIMSARKFMLAIDQGTTGTTVLIFDHDGGVRGRATSEITQHYPRPGWVEHDAAEIWQVSHRVVAAALDNAGIHVADLHGIGITNQRETVVLWERGTGQVVGPAIVWQDRRTAGMCRTLREEGLEPDWQARTGLLIDPYFSATKIAWMLECTPGLRERAEAGEIAFGTLDSWLVWNLSGGSRHVTDITNASRTLLFNIHDCRWDTAILRRLDIPTAILPVVVPSSAVCAETDPGVFFGGRVPIGGIAGDQQAALFGQGCLRKGLVKNTYGTGAFIMLNTGTTPVTSRHRMLTTVAWQLGEAPVEYALEGSVFVAGAAIQWLRDGLGIIAAAAETEALASSLSGNDGVYFVPALTGLGAPHWNPDARGLICGITRGTTRAHLVRAALESIAFQSADVLASMSRETGIALTALRADGGATANAFLMQFQADLLEVPVEVPVISETTALGAAFLAGLSTGFWSDLETLAAQWKAARRYTPCMAADERHRLQSGWARALAFAMQP